MAITTNVSYNFEIRAPYKSIAIKTVTTVYDNGNQIAQTQDLTTYNPGDYVGDLPAFMQTLSAFVWTAEVVNAYNAAFPDAVHRCEVPASALE